MTARIRRSIDLRSQDLSPDDIRRFQKTFIDFTKDEGEHQELLMFSTGIKPYQYTSLGDFEKDLKKIPENAEYFYYTLTLPSGDRCSLYLDPDRPAKVVIEGKENFVRELAKNMEKTFPKGGVRYKTQGSLGYFLIWGTVVVTSFAFILAYTLLSGSGANPYLVAWVIFVSSLLGIYLSIVKSKDIYPANTMSLTGRRKRPMIDLFLHFITVALGIISVILVLLFVEFNL